MDENVKYKVNLQAIDPNSNIVNLFSISIIVNS